MNKIEKLIFGLTVIGYVICFGMIITNAQTNQELIAQAEASNPATIFMDFVVSNYFIWFWVLFVIAAFFVPFGIVGLKGFYKWFDRVFIKPKQGYVIVRQFLPNDQVMEFFGKPTGKMLKIRDWDGNKIDIPVRLGKGWSKYSGSLPVIEIDENCRQRTVESNVVSPINQEEVTKGWKASYETGKLMGSLDFLNELRKYIMIMIVIAAVSAGISAYFGYMNMQSVSPAHLQTAIHNAIINTTIPQG